MVHQNTPAIADLCKAGHYDGSEGAVAKARVLYERDHEENVLLYASTLYSARRSRDGRKHVEALLWLHHRLEEVRKTRLERLTADECDVLSTILEWMSRRLPRHRKSLLRSARSVVERGIRLADKKVGGGHTYPLLLLTEAMILFGQNKGKDQETFAYANLATVGLSYVEGVSDPDQKSRIYRKLSAIRLSRGQLKLAINAFRLARAVPDISPDVRAKNRLWFW